jgi:tetratricopeptide (TPR) repeat protein
MFKNRRDPEAWSLAIAFLFIYLHSLLDLDLSLGFMALVAWSLLGLFNHKIKKAGGNLKQLKIPKLAALGFLSVYFLVLLPIAISVSYSSNLGTKDTYDNVVAKLEKAIKFYPLDAQNYATLGAAHYQAFQQTQEQKYLDLAIANSNLAINKEDNNYNWYLLKAEFLLAKGELKDTAALLQEGRPYLFKFENGVYADTANLYKRIALKAEEDNIDTLAQQCLKEIIVLWERAQGEMAAVEPRFLKSGAEKENILQYEPFLIEVIYAYMQLDEVEKAKEIYPELSEQTIKENTWLSTDLDSKI